MHRRENGGEEEAQNLHDAFVSVGFKCNNSTWRTKDELMSLLQQNAKDVPATKSVAIFCLMSHGAQGTIAGVQEDLIPINDILLELTTSLPYGTPLVSYITKLIQENKPYNALLSF